MVVELEDDERIALAADVCRHEVLGAVHLGREVTHVVEVARQAVQPLQEKRVKCRYRTGQKFDSKVA